MVFLVFIFFCICVVLSVFEENLRFWVRAPSLIGFIVRFFFVRIVGAYLGICSDYGQLRRFEF